MILNLFREAL